MQLATAFPSEEPAEEDYTFVIIGLGAFTFIAIIIVLVGLVIAYILYQKNILHLKKQK